MRFVGLYPPKGNFSICIKSCWIKWDKVEPNQPNLSWSLCRRERIVGLQLQAHASRRFFLILIRG